ncbi:PaaI family thioesterase [Aerosticca soli]|jgi:uncharacterized protein (TIGR00369 family)|uniref:Thioesterase domain-containing protein n=1 Tax=Aerosticca soli TaxID=2010829 RepID=A0A2Z6E3A4_9GAMM|nr:PaaI family thioesterase [Aerosticca soli]MDI3262007.1 PaaI family thioesterase [Fulvimonas sp.]BBD79530.1 hypothetical protein ALSL_0865 [Aerosticca soli]
MNGAELAALPERIRSVLTAACTHELELAFLRIADGRSEARWMPPRRFLNGHGVIQGGFIAAVCDLAMAAAVASQLPEGRLFTSINLSLTYHRPVLPADYEVHGRLLRLGRRTAYAEAELRQQDRLVTSANGSLLLAAD